MKFSKTKSITLFVGIIMLFAVVISLAQPLVGELPAPRIVEGRPLVVAFITKGFESEATQRNYHQFKIECAYRGWEIIEVTTALEKTSDAVRALIEKNVDAIVCSYSYFDYWLDEVKMAREKGIGIYSIDTEIKPGVIVCSRQFDGSAGARLMAQLIDAIGGEGVVGMLAYHMHEGVDRRTIAAESIARWYEKRGVVVDYQDITYPGYDVQAYNIATTWAQKYGEDMKAVFAGFDIPSIFAARAFEAAGFTSKNVIMGGIDGGQQALGSIRNPDSPFKMSFSQPFELYTHTTCEVIDLLQIKGVSINEALAKVGANPETGNVFLDGIVVTPFNVPPPDSTYYEVHSWYGEDPEDADAWINWWKKVEIEPYRS
jgi:ABC-type sugar transport system substrate-binding protein